MTEGSESHYEELPHHKALRIVEVAELTFVDRSRKGYGYINYRNK